MRRLSLKQGARISVALPILFVIISATIVWLVSAVLLNARDQSVVLSETVIDNQFRIDTRSVVVTAEALNSRLLGVMADVYSASGSVTSVEKIFADLKSHWAAVARSEQSDGRVLLERAAEDFRKLLFYESATIEALRSGRKENVSKIYDDTLEPSVHFRRDLRELLAIVDQRGTNKITAVLSNSHSLENLTIYTGALVLLIVFFAGLYVVLGVSRPLSAIIQDMNSLAANDLNIHIAHSGRKDEIGDIARALEIFKTSLIERSRLETQNKEADVNWRVQHRLELNRVADNLEAAVGEVLEIVNSSAVDLTNAADMLTGTVNATQRLSELVTIASSQTSDNIDSIANSTEELLASASEVRAKVDEASHVAEEAAVNTRKTSERLTKLSSATNSIGEMANAIAAIAQQTNLLALNATIEAARAGEEGRGFSIVASEVKVLATRTAQVTNEITAHIESVRVATREAVSDMTSIASIADQLSEVAKSVSDMALGQQGATQKIAEGAKQVAIGASDVAVQIAGVSRGANETGSAAAQVMGAAHNLSSEGRKLKDAIKRVTAKIRAA